jgi:four helix bundle protein
MHNIEKLMIWKKSLDLAEEIYKITDSYPKHELFGIVSQMRRAAVSIGSNIAEGAGRDGAAEFNRFLSIANGSANELRFQIEVSTRRSFITEDTRQILVSEINHLISMNVKLQNRLKEEIIRNNRKSAS